MSAPFAPDPLTTATALLSFPRFGLFTTICPPPKSSDAGRFSADMPDSLVLLFGPTVKAENLEVEFSIKASCNRNQNIKNQDRV
jgi:hypothetical protein